MDIFQQSDVYFLIHYICQRSPPPPTKEQVSYNFMTEVIIHSDFGAQENEICHCFHFFPIYLQWSDRIVCHDLPYPNVEFFFFFFQCWVLSQPFHSLILPSTRGSLVLLPFLPLGWCHWHIWGCWYFSPQSWFQLVLHAAQHFTWCTPHIS